MIFEVSALCSIVIGVVPFIPVLTLFFHNEIDRIQVFAMVLAIWGFASYLYLHYADNSSELKIENKHVHEVSLIPLLKEVNLLTNDYEYNNQIFSFINLFKKIYPNTTDLFMYETSSFT